LKESHTWIVVADGGQARILLSSSNSKGVQQLPNGDFRDPLLATHELTADNQMRVHESVGPVRHSIEPKTDQHVQRKQQLLARLSGRIELAYDNNEFENLLIVAPATAMGNLRKEFSPALRHCVTDEIMRDYTRQSNDCIYEHIREYLPRCTCKLRSVA
jgi:protein required for attachment to host cells